MDGGDKDKGFFAGGDLADDQAEDAEEFTSFLTANNFAWERISQYWGNSIPGFFLDETGDSLSLKQQFKTKLQEFKAKFECASDDVPVSCCHEFFLFISAHGGTEGFTLFDPKGTGKAIFVGYDFLLEQLKEFPKCVKLVVFLDVCRSGSALDGGLIPDLSNLCTDRADCGVTIVTATDAVQEAPGGQGPTDTATQDFMEGAANKDHDGDGKVGDFGDRWLHMKSEGGSTNTPQRLMCAGQTSMCSTD